MPVGISSPARNLFLLGSSGDTLVTNFFKSIDKSSSFDEVYVPKKIKYSYDSYILAGYAQDSGSRRLSWVENRTYNPDNASSTEVWHQELESLEFDWMTGASNSDSGTSLFDLCIDENGNLFAVGDSNNTNWIAKYNSTGALQWTSTSFRAQSTYRAVASDGNCLYVCGESRFSPFDSKSFVEKYDYNGATYWGTVVDFEGAEVNLKDVGVTSDGNVIAVGNIDFDYGYMVKLDSGTGEVLWDKTIKSPIYRSNSSEPENVRPEKLFVDGKGQIYVVGRILYASDYYSFLIKFDPEGNIIWQRTTESSVNGDGIEFFDVSAETDTEQVIVYGSFSPSSGRDAAMLSKYTKDGSLLWRRTIETNANPSGSGLVEFGFSLDADSSFYYMSFVDQLPNTLNGVPDRYTFGKVSTSGNGLGDFQYTDGMSHTIDYKIKNDLQHKTGVLQDNSVSTNVSNLISSPFSANTILFDDYATNISGKKRILGHTHGEEVANRWFYSSGAAFRPVDLPSYEIVGADLPSGSVANGAVYQTPTLYAPYWEFDGTNDDIDGPPCNTILDQSSSIELWVWFDDVTTRQTIISGYNSPSGGAEPNRWDFEISNGRIQGGFHDNGYFTGTTVLQAPPGSADTGYWHHLMFVLSSSTLKFYLDGVEEVSQSCSGFNFGGPTIALGIGDRNNSSIGRLDGRIAEVRTYKKVLTDEEIFQNFNSGVGTYDTSEKKRIAPKITNDVPYSFNQTTRFKAYFDFGNRYSYSPVENRLTTSFRNGSNWGTTNATKQANAAIAPDGTKTATLVTEEDVTGFHFISSAASVSGARTFSAYLKAGNQERATMFLTQSGNNGARFNLETGQVISVFGAGNTAAIEKVGGGWYRCSVANDGVANTIDNQLRISPRNGATNGEAPGSPLRSILVWGPQVEKRLLDPPTAGRYIRTYNQTKTDRGNLHNLVLTGEKPFLQGNILNAVLTNDGTYLAFDGVDDNITFNSPILIGTGSGVDTLGWTVEVWIRFMDPQNDNTNNTWNYFFRNNNTSGATYECGMYSNGTPAFAIKDNDAANTNVQTPITPATWHYIAFGVNAFNSNKVFMTSSDANGSLTNQESTAGASAASCDIKRIMSNQSGGQCLTGHVGEIRIFDKPLSSTLLQRNFNATRTKYGI